MTTKETDTGPDTDDGPEEIDQLNANLAKLEELSGRLVAAVSRRKAVPPSLQGPGQDMFM